MMASDETTAARVSYGSGSPNASTSRASAADGVTSSILRCSNSPRRGGTSVSPGHHHTPPTCDSRPVATPNLISSVRYSGLPAAVSTARR